MDSRKSNSRDNPVGLLAIVYIEQQRHHPSELKTTYLAHGPCLTDVRDKGNYGSQLEVGFDAQVKTLRTDDYARTFQKFNYTFDREVTTAGAWLFKMGRTGYTLYQIANGRATEFDQSVHGNDFWQTDYDATTGTYQRTYNLPLDGLSESKWILRKPQIKP